MSTPEVSPVPPNAPIELPPESMPIVGLVDHVHVYKQLKLIAELAAGPATIDQLDAIGKLAHAALLSESSIIKPTPEQVAIQTVHHIDTMYPKMWLNVSKVSARRSIKNTIIRLLAKGVDLS